MSTPQPAAPKKRHLLRWIFGGIGGLFLLMVIIGVASSAGKPAPVAVTSPAPTVTVTVTAPAAPAPTVTVTKTVTATVTAAAPAPASPAAPAAGSVIYQKSGSGISSTPNFTTPAEWQLQWSYDCSAFSGGTGNFIVNSEDDQANVNELGAGGSDSTYVHSDPGQHSLQINSECNWTVKVIGG